MEIEQPLSLLKKDYLNFKRKHKKLYIFNSFGMSLDGKIATYTGDSKYISNPTSRELVHELRDFADAILVGINTIMIDHPTLTTRLKNKLGKDSHRVILDSKLSIDLNEPILTLKSLAKTIVVTLKGVNPKKQEALRRLKVTVLEVKANNNQIDLNDLSNKLFKLGIKKLMVEGGSTVHFSFYKDHLVNYSFITISPLIIGGENAKTAVGGKGFATLKEAVKLKPFKVYNYSSDLVILTKPQY
jgi:diaminohydroxyphosphoribosylaminopyrimidine deaminase/5-amino-6-(5-phosphoribosylamino)uracil reductase